MAPPPSWQVRLHRDLTELFKEPLKGIDVVVDEQDMRTMCLILTPQSGAFLGCRLHLSVSIPLAYPTEPPRVSIQTPVPHPNVFGGSVCCDILKSQAFRGSYTPGYLLKYVFLQLLSFFSSENIEQSYGGNRNLKNFVDCYDSRRYSISYVCEKCLFHKSDTLQLEVAEQKAEISEGNKKVKDVIRKMYDTLNIDCRMEIIDKLDDRDILSKVKLYDGSVEIENLLVERRLKCFYLRKELREKDVVLGIGVSFDVNSSKPKPTVMSLDLLSYEAFSDYGYRRSILGVSFEHFLPVVLDDDHFRRAKTLIQKSLVNLTSKTGVNKLDWGPATVLQTLPAMMNLMVLKLAQYCDKQEVTLFQTSSGFNPQFTKASETALEGYCLLYHLFSKLVRDNKKLADMIRGKVQGFIQDINLRGKDAVPDIGEFLTYLLVIDGIEWQPKDPNKPQVAQMFLGECLTRNVLWYLKDFPHLAYIEPDNFPSELRIQQTFQSCRTSLRLVLFQVHFFKMTRSMEKEFDKRYGFPAEKMIAQLMETMREIYSAADWSLYLKIFGLGLDGGWKWQVVRLLKRSIESSQRRGYHVVPYSNSELYMLRRAVEPLCPAPKDWIDDGKAAPLLGRSFFPQTRRPPSGARRY